jgi:intracellular sulfur oxidation DsrE/DsrF family protein
MSSFDLSRHDFIATGVSAAAGIRAGEPVAASSPAEQPTQPPVSGAVPFPFDRAAFQAIVERPYPHRQLVAPSSFQATTVAMSHIKNSLAAYADPHGFAGGPNSLHCAAVLYAGRSYTMAFDDAMYAKYPLGLIDDEEMRPNDTSARAYWTALRRNPMADFVRSLTEQGVSLFVCNNALSGFAVELARRVVVPPGSAVTRERVVAIHDELAAHFLPGTMLVPAGVAAVNAAQEARFTFLP